MPDWPKREQVDPADLLGPAEVLEICGWKTHKSLFDAQESRGFPPPVVEVRSAKLWHREDVRRWLSLQRR